MALLVRLTGVMRLYEAGGRRRWRAQNIGVIALYSEENENVRENNNVEIMAQRHGR